VVRGEIYFMDLAPRSGAEQRGRRPCILVSHDAFTSNPRWRSVTVVPLTAAARWQRPSPTTVVLREGDGNLPKASAALAHQVTTIDKAKILEPAVGRLTNEQMKAVDEALRNYLKL
jgi:mRNA-degrading endonuclease toxin of MazEF toxin-antitoxin module